MLPMAQAVCDSVGSAKSTFPGRVHTGRQKNWPTQLNSVAYTAEESLDEGVTRPDYWRFQNTGYPNT